MKKDSTKHTKKKFSLAIHGGAGTISKKEMTPAKRKKYKEHLKKALKAGYHILKNGGTALDAVTAAVIELENCPLFNAGKGSVMTSDGIHELDASIMNGKNLMAGAVTGVRTIKNPILAAKAVMEKSEHVMLAGIGAETFAKKQKLEMVENKYFYTEERFERWQKIKSRKAHNQKSSDKKGTVGAVAIDQHGNLAAATSTGGMTNKKFGRIGDSPIVGAGTYADNNTCAVSSTGWGEFFIRAVAAHDVSCLVEYKKISLQKATEVVIKKIEKLGGDGGLIAVDPQGNIAMSFNSEGMYRGQVQEDGHFKTEIF